MTTPGIDMQLLCIKTVINTCFAEELQLIADEGLHSPSRNVQKKNKLAGACADFHNSASQRKEMSY